MPSIRLSELPTDWLEAFADYVGEDGSGNPDATFGRRIAAAFRMREIERREGRPLSASADAGLAELARRSSRPDERPAARHGVDEALVAEDLDRAPDRVRRQPGFLR